LKASSSSHDVGGASELQRLILVCISSTCVPSTIAFTYSEFTFKDEDLELNSFQTVCREKIIGMICCAAMTTGISVDSIAIPTHERILIHFEIVTKKIITVDSLSKRPKYQAGWLLLVD